MGLAIQLGTRTWEPELTQQEEDAFKVAAQGSTTSAHGVCVVSGKLRDQSDTFVQVGARHEKPVTDKESLVELLRNFLHTESLRKSALTKLEGILAWWRGQNQYAFYGSALLLSYDTHKNSECRVCVADFSAV